MLYSKPVELKAGETLRAQAYRLGYQPSGTVTYRHGQGAVAAERPAAPYVSWREKLNESDLLERLLAIKDYDGRWAEGTGAFLAALKDKDAPVRYWAVVGLHLGCKDAAAIAKAKPAVLAVLEDPSPSVSVAAAQALVDWGEAEKGLARLLKPPRSGGGKGGLFAAWALWYLGDKARPALEKIRSAGGGRGNAVTQRALARLKKPM
jgi:hypothetical protein